MNSIPGRHDGFRRAERIETLRKVGCYLASAAIVLIALAAMLAHAIRADAAAQKEIARLSRRG